LKVTEKSPLEAANIPLWLVGYGDIGARILGHNLTKNIPVRGVMRSESGAVNCRHQGGEVYQRDLDANSSNCALDLHQAKVIYLAPPPTQGITDSRLENFLKTCGDAIERIVLISTTAVYGVGDGGWIDESKLAAPSNDRGKRRLHAENCVQGWAERTGGNYVILRVPGIYAADRLPIKRLQRGEPVIIATECPYTNRIHADDLANICLQAMYQPVNNEVFNVSDGNPSSMTDYFYKIADTMGIERPPAVTRAEASSQISGAMMSYLKGSYRISNRKLLTTLNIKLRYPDLDSALKEMG
jgi:nucleoside-diphosphate-sugar epimerase